jgi:hypothetical protein
MIFRNSMPAAGSGSGANVVNRPGLYVRRVDAFSWIDSSGNLWLFGGDGLDSIGKVGLLNDLWRYTP